MKRIWLLLAVSVTLFATEALVDVRWLAEEMKKNKKIVVLDVSDNELYKEGHIPGSLNSPIANWREKHGNFLLVKEKEAIQKEFERLGIMTDSYVVVYSHHNSIKDFLKASYVLWAMEYYGLKKSSMLDGGMVAWREMGAPLEMQTSKATNRGDFRVRADKSLVADMQFVKQNIGRANMIDARPSMYYFGAQKQAALAKAGHIPKAKSYFWRYSFKGDYLKSKEKLKEMLVDGLGLDPKRSTITYCTGGLETSMNFFVLHRILGFEKIRLYDASMKEWANSKSTPMQKYKWE